MSESSVSRRDFARHVVLGTGAVAAGLTGGAGSADDTPQPAIEAPPAPPLSEPMPSAPERPEWEDLQLAALLQTYPGAHLSAEMLLDIARDLRRRRIQSAILRQYALENSDPPSFVFAAYRAAGG